MKQLKWLKSSLIILALLAQLPQVAAQLSFKGLSPNINIGVYGMTVDSVDHSLIVCGDFNHVNGQQCQCIFKLRNDSALFYPFHWPFLTTIIRCATYYQGKLFVGGGSLLAYLENNSWHIIDSTNLYAFCFYHYGDKLLIGGNFDSLANNKAVNLAIYDGNTFSTFKGIDSVITSTWTVTSVAEYKGNLIVGGNFDHYPGSPDKRKEITQWNGNAWTSLAGGIPGNGFENVNTMCVLNDTLYVGGEFKEATGGPGNNIAKWDGNAWHRMGNGVYTGGSVYSLIPFHDTLIVAGQFQSVDSRQASNYATYYKGYWCPNTVFANNVIECATDYFDTIVVGGVFGKIGADSCSRLAKVSGSSPCYSTSVFSHSRLQKPVKLFPLPASNELHIQFSTEGKQVLLCQVIDLTGSVLLKSTISALPGDNTATIDLRGLSSGTYFLTLGDNDIYKTAKVVKE